MTKATGPITTPTFVHLTSYGRAKNEGKLLAKDGGSKKRSLKVRTLLDGSKKGTYKNREKKKTVLLGVNHVCEIQQWDPIGTARTSFALGQNGDLPHTRCY